MQAKDLMTRQVVSIDPEASVLQAARLMLQHRVSGLPVVDAKGALVGIVTEGDFLRRAELGTARQRPRWLEFLLGPGRLADDYVHASGRKVSEVMSREPFSVGEDTPLAEIVAAMEKQRVKRLPVTRDGTVVGIVSRANLMHALASVAAKLPEPKADDAAIRERLMAELERQVWAPIGTVSVFVTDGVVELRGVITDDSQRRALIVAAENIAGVRQVRDHLIWVEPMSGIVVEAVEPPIAKAS